MGNYIELWEKFFCGATSAEEESALMKWLQSKSESDPKLAAYYKAKWKAVDGSMDSRIKAGIHSQIRSKIESSSDKKTLRRNRFSRVVPWVAAACVGIAAFMGWFNYAKVKAHHDDMFEVYTEKGQKTNVILPDGTRVWLNSDSRLSYNSGYNLNTREVSLTGEGYFEVAKDQGRRFSVNTGNYKVEALGTAFNIKSYPSDEVSVATLLEGKVRISDNSGFSATLAPLESVVYNKSDGRFSHNDSYRTHLAGQWRHNELVIENGTTLETLAHMLAREYNIHFSFRSERIKGLAFEGIIKDNNLHNVLQIIGLSGEVTYTIENNTVVLDEKR